MLFPKESTGWLWSEPCCVSTHLLTVQFWASCPNVSHCKHLCPSITKPFGNNWSHIVMEGGRNTALCSVCTLHLVMLSSWIPPFQAETCFDWCAKGHGRGPTKRIPESWVTSVPVWQWIASASCPLIQNKKCGKPGKPATGQTWRLEFIACGKIMCVSFVHSNLPVDRGKPARPSRDLNWTAPQWCTSKSPQAFAPLPCSKWGELWVSVEAVLQSASVQVQAIQVVILLLINSVGDHLEWLCSNAYLENGLCLSHYRRYILDIIPAVASHRALRFLRHKMERQEITNWEAAQTVLVALHSSTPTRDVMEQATVGFCKHSKIALY